MELLLVRGCSPNLRDNFGGSALLEAVKASDDEMLDLLLSYEGR